MFVVLNEPREKDQIMDQLEELSAILLEKFQSSLAQPQVRYLLRTKLRLELMICNFEGNCYRKAYLNEFHIKTDKHKEQLS